MKLINDNFDDYFESSAPKSDNAPHEETPEEREERELIETTIERRSNKKRIFLALGTLVVLLLLIFLVRDRYFHVYHESSVKGRIIDIGLEGSVFQTYEGKMMCYDVQTPTNVVKQQFDFSVLDDSIVQVLGKLKQTPIAVQLEYKEYKSTVPWRGNTKYIVTGIDTVNIAAYSGSIKDDTLPQPPANAAK